MTLHTANIKRCGDKLYKRLLSNRHLSDDTCMEAYENFIRRLKVYRDKHPEAHSVSPRFVRNCERWITADLLRKKKRRKVKAAVELELSRHALPASQPSPGTGNTFMFLKLEGFSPAGSGKNPRPRPTPGFSFSVMPGISHPGASACSRPLWTDRRAISLNS